MKRIALLMFVFVACATTPPKPSAPDPTPDLEAKLRAIPTLHLRYYVETTGAIVMLARGSMEWDAEHLRIDVSGSLAGERKSTRYERPADRRRDVIETWIRVGLAHNFYRLLSDQETETLDAHAANVKAVEKDHYAFDLIVGGKSIGSADLWLDANGLPLRREQTMRVGKGEVKVTERYLWLP